MWFRHEPLCIRPTWAASIQRLEAALQAEVLQAEQVLKEAVDARKACKKQAGRCWACTHDSPMQHLILQQFSIVTRTVWDSPEVFQVVFPISDGLQQDTLVHDGALVCLS